MLVVVFQHVIWLILTAFKIMQTAFNAISMNVLIVKLRYFLERGRSLVGDAGVLVSEIVLIANKSEQDEKRWIYTDVGVL